MILIEGSLSNTLEMLERLLRFILLFIEELPLRRSAGETAMSRRFVISNDGRVEKDGRDWKERERGR